MGPACSTESNRDSVLFLGMQESITRGKHGGLHFRDYILTRERCALLIEALRFHSDRVEQECCETGSRQMQEVHAAESLIELFQRGL